MKLNELRDRIHENAKKKGFYESIETIELMSLSCDKEAVKHAFFAQRIALIHSELSEALEADRKDRYVKTPNLEWAFSTQDESHLFQEHFPENIKNTVEDELADVIIRTLDLCGYLGIDIEKHIELKMRYNEQREYKHGKKY